MGSFFYVILLGFVLIYLRCVNMESKLDIHFFLLLVDKLCVCA